MRSDAKLVARHPAETASLGSGAVAALIAAVTGMEATAAALVVGAVGVLPGVVTFLVNTTRKGTQTAVLVRLTPDVATAAKAVLEGSAREGDWKDQADALDRVAGAVSKWADLLVVQPPGSGSDSTE